MLLYFRAKMCKLKKQGACKRKAISVLVSFLFLPAQILVNQALRVTRSGSCSGCEIIIKSILYSVRAAILIYFHPFHAYVYCTVPQS